MTLTGHCAEWEKPVTETQIECASIFVRCPVVGFTGTRQKRGDWGRGGGHCVMGTELRQTEGSGGGWLWGVSCQVWGTLPTCRHSGGHSGDCVSVRERGCVPGTLFTNRGTSTVTGSGLVVAGAAAGRCPRSER